MIATVRQLVFFHHLSHCLLNIHSARMCFQHPLFLFSASSLKRPSSPSPRRAFVSRRSSLAINITIILSSVDFVVEQRRRVGVDATPTAHAQLRRYGGHSHRQRTWRLLPQRTWRPLPQTAHVEATPTDSARGRYSHSACPARQPTIHYNITIDTGESPGRMVGRRT